MDTKTASLTAGPLGPQLIQDHGYIDEMAHFDRERIPERVVHAKGAGGYCPPPTRPSPVQRGVRLQVVLSPATPISRGTAGS